jgi:hypothetical protein
MLFDIHSRGRRRTVQTVYLGLAVIFLLGFIGFGVGGGFGGGGVFNAINNGKSGSGSSYAQQVAAQQKAAQRDPRNAQAWANLIKAQFTLAGQGNNYDQTTSTFTSQGKQVLAQAQSAWNHYLALNPSHPDPTVASYMLQALGVSGLNQAKGALQAAQIVAASQSSPSWQMYYTIAGYAYEAKQTQQGDLAAAEAERLVPSSSKTQLKSAIAQLRAGVSLSNVGSSSSSSSSSSAGGAQVTTLPAGAAGATTSTSTPSSTSSAGGAKVSTLPAGTTKKN